MIYIYSFIEGETKWSDKEPTEIDKEAVADGQLEVLRVMYNMTEVHTLDEHGEWVPTDQSEVVMTHGQEWHE